MTQNMSTYQPDKILILGLEMTIFELVSFKIELIFLEKRFLQKYLRLLLPFLLSGIFKHFAMPRNNPVGAGNKLVAVFL